MDKIVIRGGAPLKGEIEIAGAKNSALKLMAASLLTSDTLSLKNVPDLFDVKTLISLLEELGVKVEGPFLNGTSRLNLNAGHLDNTTASYDLVRQMRASVLVLGPLLARIGQAKISLPGGCAIGTRPIDFHLTGLERMGAEIELKDGYVIANTPRGVNRLRGAEINLPFPSMGATENLMMAATLADGTTVIENAAREPEIEDLASCLVAMGAVISGAGTERITIEGQDRLHGAEYTVMADRIEAGTYAMAAAITGGDVTLKGLDTSTLDAVVDTLRQAGVTIEDTQGGIRVSREGNRLEGVDVMTQPFPGFPTDLQAQFMALMSVADGASMITETIFESRFMHVPELSRLGANINVHGSSALVRGVERLKGAQVMATDLRASVALVIAALVAEGETTVNRVYHLDRGFERLEEKLGACGADIERVAA